LQEYEERIREEIEKEQERKDLLLNRVKQLENQINTLIQDSLGLLKVRLLIIECWSLLAYRFLAENIIFVSSGTIETLKIRQQFG